MQPNRSLWARPTAALLSLLAVLALAACGSSTPSSTTSRSAASTSTAPGGGAPAGGFKAVRECLKKQGITLPERVAGGKRPPAGSASPLGGKRGGFRGAQLPKGVSRAKFEAAMKKCGGGFAGGAGGGFRSSPAYAKALAKFAECMRTNGVSLPTPNTSGSGPVFSTKGLNTGSAKFRAARTKCSPLLNLARPGRQGAPGAGSGSAGPPEGAPGAGAAGAPPEGAPGG